jgi:protein-tyrosine phosphatase
LADYGKLKFLTRLGCIFQVTAGVFVDRFSSANKLLAEKMLEDGMISYIASDTHSVKRRPNDMHAAREHIAMLSSEEKAHQLTFEVPYQITSKSVMWI